MERPGGVAENLRMVQHRIQCFNDAISGDTRDLSRDIHPLTDFKRNTPEFLHRLKENGHPLVLTVNGKAEIVVQDAKSYQQLLDLAERLETIETVKEGLASVDLGEGRPMDDVFDALEKNLRFKARP